jgi:hypothetical protein
MNEAEFRWRSFQNRSEPHHPKNVVPLNRANNHQKIEGKVPLKQRRKKYFAVKATRIF